MFEQTLASDAKRQLAILAESKILDNAYLAGGSALALFLGHRISYDLDFFTPKEFDNRIILQKLSSFNFILEQESPGTLLGQIGETRFSFFLYRYPLIAKVCTYRNIRIAGLKDLAAMKVAAVSSRGTKRDFVDLYYLRSHFSLKEMLECYDLKFRDLNTNKIHILKSLDYFADADIDPEPNMLVGDYSWEEVKDFFRNETKKLLNELS